MCDTPMKAACSGVPRGDVWPTLSSESPLVPNLRAATCVICGSGMAAREGWVLRELAAWDAYCARHFTAASAP